MRKKGVCLLFALLALLLAAGASAAESEPIIGSGRGRLLSVRFLEEQEPFVFENADGKPGGLYIELLEAISRRSSLRFRIDRGHYAGGAADDQPDLIIGSTYPVAAGQELYGYLPVRNFDPDDPRMTRTVAQMFDLVAEDQQEALSFAFPLMWESSSLFLPQGSSDGLEDLRGKRICVVQDSPEETFLRNFGFASEIFRCANVSEGMRTLSLRICDAFVCETFQGVHEMRKERRYSYTIRQRPLPLQSYERAVVVLRGNMELTLKIGHALREIKSSGRYSQILDRWLTGTEEYLLSPGFLLRAACVVLFVLALMVIWNHALGRRIRVAVKERERIFDFVREGLLAVDAAGRITMLNQIARRLLDLGSEVVGLDADTLIPGLDIGRQIRTLEPEYNIEQNLRGALVSCNKAPVVIGGKAVGAIVTFHDLSELTAVAEEMTGVKMYVESLRIHNHEYMNMLQAVSGLIQLGQYDKAVRFIAAETGENHSAESFMTERIKSAAVCGILMGKAGLCREQHIRFVIDPDSYCADHGGAVSDRSLVIIVGNLVQNAIEAVLASGVNDDSQITFAVYDESGHIFISVRDTAGAMDDAIAARVFEKGFSTRRKKDPSGFGLYNIRTIVEALGGDITVDYVSGEYTEFAVTIPIPKKEAVSHV